MDESRACVVELAVQVILSVEDVVLEWRRQRQEAHEDGRVQTQATQAAADAQATQMLQAASVLWGRSTNLSTLLGTHSYHTQLCTKTIFFFLSFLPCAS